MTTFPLVVFLVSRTALFKPNAACPANAIFDAVRDWNHLFVGARHNVPIECELAEANAPSLLPTEIGGIHLRCASSTECSDLIAQYVLPAASSNATSIAMVQAASGVIGATQLACNVTADCNHPAAVCVPSSALPGVGYCAPQTPTAETKDVCYVGMHASCNELITATIGVGIGLAVWAIGYKFF